MKIFGFQKTQVWSRRKKFRQIQPDGMLWCAIKALPSNQTMLQNRGTNNPITFVDCSHIFVQSRFPWSGLLTTLPWQSNPKISFPTLLVLPDSNSCLCRNNFWRARPRPLSRSPCVNTPSKVLFPASTFPTTATLKEILMLLILCQTHILVCKRVEDWQRTFVH